MEIAALVENEHEVGYAAYYVYALMRGKDRLTAPSARYFFAVGLPRFLLLATRVLPWHKLRHTRASQPSSALFLIFCRYPMVSRERMKNKTRKDVAKCLDIGIETLRYYEKMGIMPSPERDENNYRIYSDDAILRLRFILSAKKYGFTLKEIELMLSSVDRNGLTRSGFRAEIQGKIDIIDSKISELMMLKEALGEIRDREDDCEILSQIMKK